MRETKYESIAKVDLSQLLGIRDENSELTFDIFKSQHNRYIGRYGTNLPVKMPSMPDEDSRVRFLEFNRSQAFTPREQELAEAYARVLHAAAQLDPKGASQESITDFWPMLSTNLVEQAIAASLVPAGSPHMLNTVVAVLQVLRETVNSTYEGGRITLNVLVGDRPLNNKTTLSVPFKEYIDRDRNAWAPCLGASQSTAIKVSADGYVASLTFLERTPLETSEDAAPPSHLYPEILGGLASHTFNQSDQDTTHYLGFAITESGDIAVLAQGELRFVFRRGGWRSVPENLSVQKWGAVLFSAKTPPPSEPSETTTLEQQPTNGNLKSPVRKAVIESLLDASFHKRGATIAVVSRSQYSKFLTDCHPRANPQRLSPEHLWVPIPGVHGKTVNGTEKVLTTDIREHLLREGLGARDRGDAPLTFMEFSREQRLELLSMDGATIISSSGEILASGAIVTVSGGSSGGRTSAALALAEYGCAFKVSQDGTVTLYDTSREGKTEVKERVLNSFG